MWNATSLLQPEIRALPLAAYQFYNSPVNGALTTQSGDKAIEHCGMNRLKEVHAGAETVDPAHFGLERMKPVELHPKLLAKRRPFDEL